MLLLVYENYTKYLNLFYFKAEKDQFFSSLLSEKKLNIKMKEEDDFNDNKHDNNINKNNNRNKEKNTKIEKIIKKTGDVYLEKLIYNENNIQNNIIKEQFEMNRIEIILGLKLPGIKSIINLYISKDLLNIIKYERKNNLDYCLFKNM